MTIDLPAADHAARRARLRPLLADLPADLLLVTNPANVRYLSGFRGTNGQVLVGAEAAADRLVTDPRYEARAATESPDLAVVVTRDPVEAALEVVAGGRLAFEAGHVSWAAGRDLHDRAVEAGSEAVAAEGLVESLRTVKDAAEVARLERACSLTVDALAWFLDEAIAPGRSERDLATALARRFVDIGADGPAFPPIVATGANAAVPHHEPGGRPVAVGDLLLVDCGALVDGYHADCTRMVAIGDPDPDLASVHEVVRGAQAAGRAAAVPGATAGDVDRAAREVIEAAGLGDRFVHGTGHGVGLEVHEAPAVSRGSPAILETATALTVEPGVYLPGTGGIRIEDTILVTADGPRPLTDAPRDLRVLST